MRFLSIFLAVIIGCAVTGLVTGCKKDSAPPTPPVHIPAAVITSVTNINTTSVLVVGQLADTTTATDMGIVWATDSSLLTVPTISTIKNGVSLPRFTDTLKNLQPNTTYYVRPYITYSWGISYGVVITFTTLPPSVYIAGYDGSAAVYWKDGVEVQLSDGTPQHSAWAHSVYVAGNDVYAAGEQYNDESKIVAMYWKNGTAIPLTDGSSNTAIAYSICVDDNDVYAAGYELNGNYSVAKYWKNGVPVALTGGSADNSGIAYSICVSDGDVYVAGFSSQFTGFQTATYWKNGVAVPLIDDKGGISSAQSIFVDGKDVYVAGQKKFGFSIGGVPLAMYWKNGTAIPLTDGSQFAGAYSVFVSGGDVYTAGYEYSGITGYSLAKYWKNNIAVSLSDGTKYANANSIYVRGNDVYVAGGEDDSFDAKYWKNSIAVPLTITDKFSRANSIFVY